MVRVLGLGGVFFRSPDPVALTEWYRQWLGMPVDEAGYVGLQPASMPAGGFSVWSPFPAQTAYFGNREQPFMINLVVDDLDDALACAEAGGARVAAEIQDESYGRFGWFTDPDGNRVELWQPARPPAE